MRQIRAADIRERLLERAELGGLEAVLRECALVNIDITGIGHLGLKYTVRI